MKVTWSYQRGTVKKHDWKYNFIVTINGHDMTHFTQTLAQARKTTSVKNFTVFLVNYFTYL